MHFSKDLYISDSLKKEKKELMRKVKYGVGKARGYIIYRRDYDDTMEFMDSKFLEQKYLKRKPIEIIGLTKDYGEALDYMVKDYCLKNGYILDKEEE